ncbi:hypothetical protein NEISICOT_00411 [Neisseria sicca ATCC 29256]|uniref:Uncharacterized protein n=1 Tax=Neisseria sicca ATCC 29256 TaxID=547045 RepID=C6M1M6_NEISI|nr:hypothetical protein NEISICOT_00411 [Neisseria sicca ATCC 29256]
MFQNHRFFRRPFVPVRLSTICRVIRVEKSDFIHRKIQTITDYPTLFS